MVNYQPPERIWTMRKFALSAAAISAAISLAACGTNGTSSSTHTNAPAQQVQTTSTQPAVNPVCNTIIPDWNQANNDIGGTDEYKSGDDFTTLGADVSALGLLNDGKFLTHFGSVLRYDADGDYTPAQQQEAVNLFKATIPGIKADVLAKCPGNSFN